jgi:ATP-dependent RNA helicase SUPV3L1/SUV3
VLAPLFHLGAAEDVTGMARGIAFQLIESLGVLERQKVAEDVKGLDQPSRAGLRKYGVRFGAYNIYIPALLKPTPRALATQLYALKHAGAESKGLEAIEQLAKSGRTSIAADKEVDRTLYRVAGYRVCGERAVRADILERIADIIRPALAWRPNAPGPRPPGAIDGFGFTVVPAMTSLAGCAGEEFASILRALGYRMEQRPKPVESPSVAPAPAGAAAEAATSVPEAALAPEVDSPAEAPADVDAAVAGTVEDAPAESETPDLVPAIEAAAVSADSPMVENTPAPEPEPAAAPPPESVSGPDEAVAADVSAETASAEIASTEAVAADSIAPEISEAAAADSAEAAPPADPELIEVWRPGRPEGQRRQRRPQRPSREAGRRRDYHAPPVTADGTAPAVAQGEGAAASDAIAAAPQGAPGADTAVGEARPPHHRQRHERRDGAERGERAGRPSRPDRPEWSKRTDGSERRSHRGNRQDRGDRPDRDPDLRAKYMKGRGEGGDRRDKAPDPNSPFAKLAALKAQLEGNSKEPN